MKTKESRFQIHDELTAPEGSAPILKGALSSGGQLSNFVGALAGSPAALRGYARFRSELRHGTLPWATQQRIALGVAETAGSGYAQPALQRTARQGGIGIDEIGLAREFDSADEKEAALLRFIKALVTRGRVSARPLARGGPRGGLVRRAGARGGRIRRARHVLQPRDPGRRHTRRRLDRGGAHRAGGGGLTLRAPRTRSLRLSYGCTGAKAGTAPASAGAELTPNGNGSKNGINGHGRRLHCVKNVLSAARSITERSSWWASDGRARSCSC